MLLFRDFSLVTDPIINDKEMMDGHHIWPGSAFGTLGPKPLPGLHIFIMFLLYVDSSGTDGPKDASKNYVLVGVCVHEGTWFALESAFRA
jgi:hypothetical protein